MVKLRALIPLLAAALMLVEARRQPLTQSVARVVHGAHSSLWVRQQRADPAIQVAFTLALQTRKTPEELDALVRSVSDVASPQYGQFLTSQELQRHYEPSDETQQALKKFLATADAKDVTTKANAAGDYVTLRMSVATAEKLFSTVLFEYAHKDRDGVRLVRPHAEGFTVPSEIAPHVVYIDGLESFPTPRQAQFMAGKSQDGDPFAIKALKNTVADSNILVTPDRIRTQYDVPDDVSNWNGTHPANKLVVSAFLNEYYTEADLALFLQTYESKIPAGFKYPKHTGDCLAGVPGAGAKDPTGEASLDVQVTVSLSRSENIEFLCYQDLRDTTRPMADDNQEPFLKFMQKVNEMEPAPSVVSISYTDEECAVPATYRDAVNNEFKKAALKGVSILISAGDAGVQGSHMSEFCNITPCSKFVSMFPASSPWVTAVGATSLDGSKMNGNKYGERVTTAKNGDLITSGGGFSAAFEQPYYQKKAVAPYLAYADAHKLSDKFPASGRAYPDITALGHSFPVYQSAQVWRTDGTSVSAPIAASLITLLNKQRLNEGLPVLGFLNPLIYGLYDVCPHVFEDITDGNIACGGSGTQCCAVGHEATEGWDAASGVGTLKFATLARDLEKCIAKIKANKAEAGLEAQVLQMKEQSINLLQKAPHDTTVARVEQLGLVVTMFATVALVSVLVAMRGKLFPRGGFFDLYKNEPAREYLLSGEE